MDRKEGRRAANGIKLGHEPGLAAWGTSSTSGIIECPEASSSVIILWCLACTALFRSVHRLVIMLKVRHCEGHGKTFSLCFLRIRIFKWVQDHYPHITNFISTQKLFLKYTSDVKVFILQLLMLNFVLRAQEQFSSDDSSSKDPLKSSQRSC